MNITKVQIHLNKSPTATIRAWADMPNKELNSGKFVDVAHPLNEPCRQYVSKTLS